ncbi:MAG: zinc-dependent metalloprotease, partial [Flavisolibacter sp.]
EGFFNYYWDDATGKIWLDVNKLDSEFLYVTTLPAGLGSNDVGLDKGLLTSNRLVKFNRVGRKILMVQPNYSFRANSSNAFEKRAVEQSFASSTIWGFTVEAESSGHYLVDATDFLLRDAGDVINQLRRTKQGNFSVDKTRSAIYLPNTKNFPFNSELEATISFVNFDGQVGPFVASVTPTNDVFTLRMHHSFIQLPDNNYQPRPFDPRSSFIPLSYMDYATPVSEPIQKYFILRHRLQKKDPSAARSEAVNPIIYYLDNGTPEPIRSALLEGASWWNQAFEAAGFINAFQVKVLPDTADPMDIRYNMINWVHRSTRGWSVGESVVDPRTGEIIKGNVRLGSLRVRQDYLIAQGLLAPFEEGTPIDDKMLKMSLARLRQLAAHEVGHTLGLFHNYAASTVNRSSVMDYPPPAVTLNANGDIDISNAYATGIGDWDKISITWGYSDFAKGTNELAALNKILTDAEHKGFLYIADQDARPAGGLHPYAHLWDNGSNAVDALQVAMKVRQKALQQFGENNIKKSTPMAFLEDVLVPVYLYHRYQLEAASKTVGGMNYNYALRGDGQMVTQPLSKDEQQRALNTITACIDPGFLMLPQRIVRLIPPRPQGYATSRELFAKRTGLAFDALAPAETAADMALSLLFNTQRMNRMVEYSAANAGLGLDEMISSLIDKTWKAARRNGMEALVQMQTEQLMLTYLLAGSIDDNASYITKATLVKSLADLKQWIEAKRKTATGEYAGHLMLALDRMKAPEKAKPTIQLEAPPGQPIGCDAD